MNHRSIRMLLAMAATATTLSCASSGYAPQTPTMPAARDALRPEFRVFYDALQDYGDWVLIEPYGFVYRPRVDFASFRPYQDGFWAPNDTWGWVWISAEPFGWATYHYGNWFYDRFQGWVWTPGPTWGPAWVNWEQSGAYAGWAALPPVGAGLGDVPGGAYLYAPLSKLGATDLNESVVKAEGLGAPALASTRPIENVVERDGVRFNAGPTFAMVERARGGPLPRVKIEEVAGSPGAPARKEAAPASAPGGSASQIQAARAAAVAAANDARERMQQGGTASGKVPVVHAPKPAEEAPAPAKSPRTQPQKGAPPDSTN